MIILLHGDYIESSRNERNSLISASTHKDVRVLDGRILDSASLTQALESKSFFGGESLVVIDNLLTKLGRKTKLIETLLRILKNATTDIILWEEKEIGSAIIKGLGTVDIRLHKHPTILFQFLDTLRIGSYQELCIREPAEIVHAMLIRRVRQLLQLKDGVTPERLQGWQASRLTQQANTFTMEKLQHMYKQLLEIEYAIKSGSSPFTLQQHTEQFLLTL